jgi:hypothetical protein
VIWRLGGKRSDFAMGSGTTFAFQHDARSHAHGRFLSLFDNGPHPQAIRRSRALVLELDTNRRRATLAREFRHSPPLFARVTGNAQRLRDGGYLIGWGSTGHLTEFGPTGAVRFDAKLPEGGQNYRAFRFPWVGRPSDSPKLVHGRSFRRNLYVSWNGSTETIAWQLLTGTRESNLRPALRQPRRGFETKLVAPQDARYAAVVALGRGSKPLARSKTIRLSTNG